MIIGLVVSFAATGSIGNLLSGLMLTSTKPFDVGDRVSIGDGIIGDVVGMGVVYTEIRDLNRRLISIPNNIVLAGPITNYSEAARKDNFAVTVDVSLGYDISPKKVRRLMKRAALSTRDVLEDPSPNIYAVEFQNHAVHYRLRAYCNRPQSMISLRSGIMENMMDVFHSQGLEILSPLHHVRREDKKPGKEDLEKRVVSGDDLEEAALQGLSMFENIEGGD